MTNFEALKNSQTPDQFLRIWREFLKCGCRQRTREDHKKYCLSEEYKGQNGCRKCTIAYLNEEFKDTRETNE